MVDLPRRLAYMPLSVLKPAILNGKRHDIESLIASMAGLGYGEAPFVDERTGRLVGGHGRVEALVEMKHRGLGMPEGLVVDDDGEWLLPVQRGWSSDDDRMAHAMNLALNKIGENGGYDPRIVAEMLEDVTTGAAWLLDATGYNADDLDEILRQVRVEDLNMAGLTSHSDLDGGEIGGKAPLGQDGGGDLGGDRSPSNFQCPACGHIAPIAPGR